MSRERLLIITIVFEGGLALLAWGLAMQFEIPLFQEPLVSLEIALWGILTSLPILLGIVGWYRSPWSIFRQLKLDMERILPFFSQCRLLDLAIISLLAGLGEELFFRGFLQNTLNEFMEAWAVVLLVNLAFGIAHFISWTYVFYATIVGIYLSLVFITFENLLVVIVAHAVFDFVILAYFLHFRLMPLSPDSRKN